MVSAVPIVGEELPPNCDVLVLGGGVAGITLGLQLKRRRPELSVVIVERERRPVPEAAHKVGESTVEIQGHYLRDVLGLEDHLAQHQLRKFGLRVFFSDGAGNRDISRRLEFGHSRLPASRVGTYQIDRGRFENLVAADLPKKGIRFLAGWKVEQVQVGAGGSRHKVVASGPDGERETNARWVVDASGRRGFLKRQLGLSRKVGHHANAVWFRVAAPIDIEEWSTSPRWKARIREGQRELSTNHLMGRGYWVWIIRLASNSTSIGIVSDPRFHSVDEMANFEKALDWLERHEPQCRATVAEHCGEIRDFRTMRNYSYSVERVFSPDRWCLTGEAGVSLDPLYSPGGDLIAISNGLITDLVDRDAAGEDITDQAEIHNRLFMLMTDSWLTIYQGQYALMGNARVMVAKVIWDTAVYWAVPGLLHFQGRFHSFVESPVIPPGIRWFSTLNEHVQSFFRDWEPLDRTRVTDQFVSYYDFEFMERLQLGMADPLTPEELDARFEANLRFAERLAASLVRTVAAELNERAEQSGLEAVERWRADPVLGDLLNLQSGDEVDEGWASVGVRSAAAETVA